MSGLFRAGRGRARSGTWEGSSFADTIYSVDHEGVIAEMHGAWVASRVEDESVFIDAWYRLSELKSDALKQCHNG